MTPDFTTELHQAADDTDAPPLDPQRLLSRARARRSRRRALGAAGSVGLAAAAIAAITVVPQFVGPAELGRDASPPAASAPASPDQSRGATVNPVEAGAYTPEVVPRNEVVARCADTIHRDHPNSVLGDWAVQPMWTGTLYARDTVPLVGPGNGFTICEIPSAEADNAPPGEVSPPIADATDRAGILDQCGTVAGYDFTGWSVDSAMSQAQGTEALLMSTNGYLASCSLEPADWDSGSGQAVEFTNFTEAQVGNTPPRTRAARSAYESGLNGSSLSIKTARTPIEGVLMYGTHTLFDEDGNVATEAATATLSTDGSGETVTQEIHDGHLAIRWWVHGHDYLDFGYDVVIKDAEGTVLSKRHYTD